MRKLVGLCLFLPLVAQAHHGIFVNVEGGYAGHNNLPTAAAVSAQSKTSTEGMAWGVRLGYLYTFARHWGMGLSFGRGDYGTMHYKYASGDQKLSFYTYEFLFNADYIVNKFDARLEVGGIRSGIKYKGVQSNNTDVWQQPMFGGQLIYNLTPHQGLSLAYRQSLGGTKNTMGKLNPGVHTFMAGWQYTFF